RASQITFGQRVLLAVKNRAICERFAVCSMPAGKRGFQVPIVPVMPIATYESVISHVPPVPAMAITSVYDEICAARSKMHPDSNRHILMRPPRSLTLFMTLVVSLSGCTSLHDYVHNGFKVGPNYHQPPSPVADH